MNLTNKDLRLLATHIMGWIEIEEWEERDFGYSTGFFRRRSGKIEVYPPYGKKWKQWRPNTKKADAVDLFMALPALRLTKEYEEIDGRQITKLSLNETGKLLSLTVRSEEDGDGGIVFCTLVCAVALRCAKRFADETAVPAA